MELSYYDLVSPSPYNLNGVGHIKAVTLAEIDSLPYKLDTYLSYVNILKMDKDTYYKVTDMSEKDIDALNAVSIILCLVTRYSIQPIRASIRGLYILRS